MAYTPGPWVSIAQAERGLYRIEAMNGPIRVCPAIAHGFDDANLIAAAPDLLAALQEISEEAGFGVQQRMRKIARDAIIKIENVT